MPTRDLTTPQQDFPRLRARFEFSKGLVARAHDRANRAAEHARVMRSLLGARLRTEAHAPAPHAEIWEAAARELNRAARERDQAFGVLSHELRQSVSAALTAERLLATSDARTAAKAREVLERQLITLMKLVDTLLDFSRLSLQSGGIAREQVDVMVIVREAIDGVEPAAVERQHTVSAQLPSEPQLVRGDAVRLLQVFANLLQNAVRYTPPGGRIAVSSTTDSGWITVVVEDNGEGIDPAAQDAVFEPFVRMSSTGHGLGIGLALAARIVHLHEGRITVASRGAGSGSVFTVMLPHASGTRGDAGGGRALDG